MPKGKRADGRPVTTAPGKLAVLAVQYAIMTGRLPRVNTQTCVRCPAPAVEYHHHRGYAEAHRVDVIPLCGPCHFDAHRHRPLRRLRALRLERALSQRDLGTMVGKAGAYISQVEACRFGPRPGLVKAIARALGVPPRALYAVSDTG